MGRYGLHQFDAISFLKLMEPIPFVFWIRVRPERPPHIKLGATFTLSELQRLPHHEVIRHYIAVFTRAGAIWVVANAVKNEKYPGAEHFSFVFSFQNAQHTTVTEDLPHRAEVFWPMSV